MDVEKRTGSFDVAFARIGEFIYTWQILEREVTSQLERFQLFQSIGALRDKSGEIAKIEWPPVFDRYNYSIKKRLSEWKATVQANAAPGSAEKVEALYEDALILAKIRDDVVHNLVGGTVSKSDGFVIKLARRADLKAIYDASRERQPLPEKTAFPEYFDLTSQELAAAQNELVLLIDAIVRTGQLFQDSSSDEDR